MYFDDEKENMKNGEAIEDLDLDLDSDDKAVTWDDLLNDEDIDLSSVKKDDNLLDGADDDLSLLSDDEDVEEEIPAPKPKARKRTRSAAKRKDAFDVFGGDSAADAGEDGDLIQKDGLRAAAEAGDTIEPDLSRAHRPSARTKARMESEDDDIYFSPAKARKSSGITPVLIGVLLACLIVAGAVYFLMKSGKSVSGLDADSLLDRNQSQENLIDNNAGSADNPAVDVNAPADAAKADQAKKEDQKLVTFSVANGGRINPFVPPAGFEASKIVSSGYEILSPPEEIPSDDVANEAKRLMDITVSGILFDNVKPSAIISVNGSDYYVQVGDKVDDFQVIGINRQYVAIKDGTNIYKAQVGESFGGSQPVGGMAQRQTSGRFAGAKQYTSTSDVEVSVKDE